ncbi:MAG: hypothetical protein EX271_08685 [Acidimicrobiales bacterium]|nr:hypothetical protein [Hyphomonadaceae bacterium]RZV41126.1 MAG: hypothetical protein EX271_08685 [Acidimicrobiales bacterium]
MGSKNKESSGVGRGLALVLILVELFGAYYAGMTILNSMNTEAIAALSFPAIAAGIAGVFAYFILHVIPGIRWLMMAAMILLWAFMAYSLGRIVIGDTQAGFQLVEHKGPYIAAAIAGVFRALMYR